MQAGGSAVIVGPAGSVSKVLQPSWYLLETAYAPVQGSPGLAVGFLTSLSVACAGGVRVSVAPGPLLRDLGRCSHLQQCSGSGAAPALRD